MEVESDDSPGRLELGWEMWTTRCLFTSCLLRTLEVAWDPGAQATDFVLGDHVFGAVDLLYSYIASCIVSRYVIQWT